MKKTIALIAAVVLTAISVPAFSVEVTPESTLMDGARIIHNTRMDQASMCHQPRSNTPEKCKAHFEAIFPAIVNYISWQAIHLQAVKDGDTQKIATYEKEWQRARAVALAQSAELTRLYYPLTQSSAAGTDGQAPAPSTTGKAKSNGAPKVFKAKDKQ